MLLRLTAIACLGSIASTRSFSNYAHLPCSPPSTLTLTDHSSDYLCTSPWPPTPLCFTCACEKTLQFATYTLDRHLKPILTPVSLISVSENTTTPFPSVPHPRGHALEVSGPQPSSMTAPRLPHGPPQDSCSDFLASRFSVSVFVNIWLS